MKKKQKAVHTKSGGIVMKKERITCIKRDAKGHIIGLETSQNKQLDLETASEFFDSDLLHVMDSTDLYVNQMSRVLLKKDPSNH